MIQKLIRMLIPGPIRRPVASRIYRFIAWSMRTRHNTKVKAHNWSLRMWYNTKAKAHKINNKSMQIKHTLANRVSQSIAWSLHTWHNQKIKAHKINQSIQIRRFFANRIAQSRAWSSRRLQTVKQLTPDCYPTEKQTYQFKLWSFHRLQYMKQISTKLKRSFHSKLSQQYNKIAILFQPTQLINRTRQWLHHKCILFLLARKQALKSNQRRQRKLLRFIIKLFEKRYKKYFKNFGTAVKSYQNTVNHNRGIVLMIGTLGPGGAERQAVLTLKGLKQRSQEPVSLIAFNLESEVQRFYLPMLVAANIPVDEVNRHTANNIEHDAKHALTATKLLPSELNDIKACIHALASRRPKIAHLWLDEVNIKAGIAAVALGIPKIILSTRSMPPINFALYKPYMREGYRWLVRQRNVVMLNNSQAGARAYESWLNLPSGHIQVLRNGFEFDNTILNQFIANRLEYRARHNILPNIPLIGTVIRLSEEKRPLLWAEIAACVRHKLPEVQFLVVGDGPLRDKLVARSLQQDLVGAFHIVGYEKEALAAIAAMDLFLLTSRLEGLPNVLLEAQALGVPVITMNVGGASETVDHKKTGWVLESDNVQHAADVIVKFLSEKTWLKNASNKSQEFVRQHFGMERMIDETLSTYNNGSC